MSAARNYAEQRWPHVRSDCDRNGRVSAWCCDECPKMGERFSHPLTDAQLDAMELEYEIHAAHHSMSPEFAHAYGAFGKQVEALIADSKKTQPIARQTMEELADEYRLQFEQGAA